MKWLHVNFWLYGKPDKSLLLIPSTVWHLRYIVSQVSKTLPKNSCPNLQDGARTGLPWSSTTEDSSVRIEALLHWSRKSSMRNWDIGKCHLGSQSNWMKYTGSWIYMIGMLYQYLWHRPDMVPSDNHLYGPLKRHLYKKQYHIGNTLVVEVANPQYSLRRCKISKLYRLETVWFSGICSSWATP